ncbi:hypothetical protein JCM10212_005930 [Sporobolomyces blumeae]
MMLRRIFVSALPLVALIPSATALLGLDLDLLGLTDLNLDVDLLKNGALVNVDAYGNILGSGSCPSANVGVRAAVLGLVKVCACLNVLHIGSRDSLCPACPANASPICGAGKCACACDAGYFSDHNTGSCIPTSPCIASGGALQNYDDGTSECVCRSPYIATGVGSCVLPPSARARRHRRSLGSSGHASSEQAVFRPVISEVVAKPVADVTVDSSHECPDGETLCGNECIDTVSSLTSCGGCVGPDQPGTNCLAIPGALQVECQASRCQIASCFRGWSWSNGKCI